MTEDVHDEPDSALIARWLRGDERAASMLVAKHADPLARFIASQGARSGIEELVQDTLVRAFGSLESFRGESSFRTWLFTIARRLVLDSRRAFKRQRRLTEVKDGDAVSTYNALDSIVAGEAEGKMHEAIARLSPTQREVFTLRVNDGLSYKEIAEVAGTTEGAARVHYHNALRQVKERMHV